MRFKLLSVLGLMTFSVSVAATPADPVPMGAGGFTVWRSWDQTGGIRDELYTIAGQNPQLVKLEVLGHTYQGRELIALKVTQGAVEMPDGKRPAVLFSSNQHGSEWISAEVNRRLLQHVIAGSRANNKEIKNLLKRTELWFVLVANPDGYQYTFDVDRLWRKNLRDNNGDEQLTIGDGVDLDRNFSAHWGYDNEGSSNDPFSEEYRGPSPASEPETQALQALIDRIRPKFLSNLHSAGNRLLYPQGWQVGTLDADNPVYVALAGTDASPAIGGFNPGQAADALQVANGETTDYADGKGAVAFTVELGEGVEGSGVVFPDNEALIQAEFVRTLNFHLALARSAADPDDPLSPVGITVRPFYLDQDEIDPQNGAHSLFDFKFAISYGDPQEVRVLAKRSLGAVTLRYRINGGAVQSGSTTDWAGGERYGPGNGAHYHVVRGAVIGAAPGDSVEVWFQGGSSQSGSFTYTLASDTGNRVLILAAEDYTGASPVQMSGPKYLAFYSDALANNGVSFDVYDVDARGRTAPDNLGVLGHYDAVLWYTGDDVITREPGWSGGNASRLAMQEILEVRDFINEGGRVLYTGQSAGLQYTAFNVGAQLYDPFENEVCRPNPAVEARCLPLSGFGDSQGDPVEYWLGAAITKLADPFPISGVDEPFTGLSLQLNGADSAQNQLFGPDSFIAIADYLAVTDPAGSFPQFASEVSAEYSSGIAGEFEPHSGSAFVWSNRADQAYKRLSRTISVPAGGAALSFWTSHDLELGSDYLIVEAHTVGQDDWTTLPDANGHTSSDLFNDEACMHLLHPFLTHYQTFDAGTATCSSTGTSGSWNAATGSSAGWQQWSIDLSAYASTQIEVSITTVSDSGNQMFPGVLIDDVGISTGDGSTSFEDDADPMDGWTVPGAPQDVEGVEGPNRNDWVRRPGFGISYGAAITTPDTLYLGFGFEGITDSATRDQVMARIIDYLLP